MELRIGWLLPDLMSTYGDRGNVICIKKRAERRGIAAKIVPIGPKSCPSLFSRVDLVIGGGSQNKELEIAHGVLRGALGEALLESLEREMPALMVCGAMQLLGKSIRMPSGTRQEGLGFFDCRTLFENAPRISGDLIFQITAKVLAEDGASFPFVLGYENHAGRTYLDGGEPLGRVVVGQGNNGEDRTEGIFYKYALGSYAHGPLLPKNPFLTDWLLRKALARKYGISIAWKEIDDLYASKARSHLLKSKKCNMSE